MFRRLLVILLALCCTALPSPAKDADLRRNMYVQWQPMTTVMVGQPIVLPVNTVNITDLHITAERLDRLPAHPELVVHGSQVWSDTVHLGDLKPKGQDLDVDQRIPVPLHQAGVYVVTVDGGRGVDPIRLVINVTSLTLVCKLGPEEVLVYAFDRLHHTVAAHCQVSTFVENTIGDGITTRYESKLITSGTTDHNGLVRMPLPDVATPYHIVGHLGDSWADAEGNHASDVANKMYVYTDRPVYRPGQTVLFKAIWRQRHRRSTDYDNMADQPVTVEIKDSVGSLISRQQARTSAFGTVSGEYTLTSEPPLGAYSIEFHSGELNLYGSFKVEEYRKPEFSVTVSPDKPFFVTGEPVTATIQGKYLFGSAVAKGAFKYRVYSRAFSPPPTDNVAAADEYLMPTPNSDGRVPREDQGEFVIQGDGVLDDQGNGHISIPARQATSSQTFAIEVDLTDSAFRTQSGNGSALLAAQSYYLTVAVERPLYVPGEAMAVHVEARDWNGRPHAGPITVKLVHDKGQGQQALRETKEVSIGADGKADLTFKAPGPSSTDKYNGYDQFLVEAFGKDGSHGDVLGETPASIATSTKAGADRYPELQLVANQKIYNPGDVADLLFTTRDDSGRMLFVVEGDRMFDARVVAFTHHTGHVRFKLTAAEAPTIHFSATTCGARGTLYQADEWAAVRPKSHLINLGLSVDKTEVRPGDPATVTITTMDEHNKPVPAEVSLAAVDEAIFAVAPEVAEPIQKFFWGHRENSVATVVSSTPVYSAGAFQRVGQDVKIRKKFLDTAQWSPALLTGADGKLSLTFNFPDNLTNWRLTAMGVTKATQVGSAQTHTLVRKPFMVRVTVPRFMTRGDQTIVQTHVHNETGAPQKVKVQVKVENLTLQGPDNQTFSMAAGEEKTLDWPVVHDNTLTPRFTAAATNENGDHNDGEEQSMAAVPWGFPTTAAAAGMLPGNGTAEIPLTMPDAFDMTSGGWQLRLAPGIPGLVASSLRDLAATNQDSTDSMADTFYLASCTVDAMRHRGVTVPISGAQIFHQVQSTVPNLYGRQNNDGGWGWFKNGASDPYISSQVLKALVAARRANYLVDDERINKGVDYLRRQIHPKENYGLAATLMEAIATTDKLNGEELDDTFAHRQELDYYSQATLALALAHAKDARAGTVVDELAKVATQTSDQAHWETAPEKYDWDSDSVAATARVLQAVLAVKPQHALVEPTLRWLIMRRDTGGWGTARDSNEVSLALIEWMATHHESAGPVEVKLLVNNQATGHWTIDTGDPHGRELDGQVRANQLKPGANTLKLVSSGKGTVLYFWTLKAWPLHQDPVPAQDHGLAVNRQYFKRISNYDAKGKLSYRFEPVTGQVKVGDEVLTVVKFASWHTTKYLTVVDPLPAGFEARPADGLDLYPTGYQKDYQSQVYFRDQKVVIYQDHAEPRIYLYAYLMRATTPGRYSINPASATLAYYPEVNGNSTSSVVEVLK